MRRVLVRRHTRRHHGRLLDGREHNGLPEVPNA